MTILFNGQQPVNGQQPTVSGTQTPNPAPATLDRLNGDGQQLVNTFLTNTASNHDAVDIYVNFMKCDGKAAEALNNGDPEHPPVQFINDFLTTVGDETRYQSFRDFLTNMEEYDDFSKEDKQKLIHEFDALHAVLMAIDPTKTDATDGHDFYNVWKTALTGYEDTDVYNVLIKPGQEKANVSIYKEGSHVGVVPVTDNDVVPARLKPVDLNKDGTPDVYKSEINPGAGQVEKRPDGYPQLRPALPQEDPNIFNQELAAAGGKKEDYVDGKPQFLLKRQDGSDIPQGDPAYKIYAKLKSQNSGEAVLTDAGKKAGVTIVHADRLTWYGTKEFNSATGIALANFAYGKPDIPWVIKEYKEPKFIPLLQPKPLQIPTRDLPAPKLKVEKPKPKPVKQPKPSYTPDLDRPLEVTPFLSTGTPPQTKGLNLNTSLITVPSNRQAGLVEVAPVIEAGYTHAIGFSDKVGLVVNGKVGTVINNDGDFFEGTFLLPKNWKPVPTGGVSADLILSDSDQIRVNGQMTGGYSGKDINTGDDITVDPHGFATVAYHHDFNEKWGITPHATIVYNSPFAYSKGAPASKVAEGWSPEVGVNGEFTDGQNTTFQLGAKYNFVRKQPTFGAAVNIEFEHYNNDDINQLGFYWNITPTPGQEKHPVFGEGGVKFVRTF